MKRLINIMLAVVLFALPLEAQLGGVKYFRDNSPGYRQATLDLEKRMTNVWVGQRKRQFNWLHKGMWTQAIWQQMDLTYLFAVHAQQPATLNIIKRAHNATAVNSPTFTRDRGITGDGASSYVNTNFTPSTDGRNYTQNGASMGIYSLTNSSAEIVDFGGRSVGYAQIGARLAAEDSTFTRLNNASTLQSKLGNNNSSGFFVIDRVSSTGFSTYRNGSVLGSSSIVSNGLPGQSLFIGSLNNNGAALTFSARQYGFAYTGGSLSASQHYHFNRIVERYMDDIGAGVQ